MIRRPPRSTLDRSSAASDVYKRQPLYLFDEWVGYSNGTESAVNMVKEGKWGAGWRDTFGSLEFTVYALAVGMAAEAKDPTYFAGYAQFREFLKWNAERSMTLYHQAKGMTEFKCCLLYTSDAADERSSVDLGGRRIIKKKKRDNRKEIDKQT